MTNEFYNEHFIELLADALETQNETAVKCIEGCGRTCRPRRKRCGICNHQAQSQYSTTWRKKVRAAA